MARISPLDVGSALNVPPLHQGSLVAGHRGLAREIRWVDIMHAPAESFISAGDLVLTTGADVRQPDVRKFLTHLISSPAAGVVLSPPPEVAVHESLAALTPLAERHGFPIVLLPWDVAFSEVQRSLLPLVAPAQPDLHVHMIIGRRERDDLLWNAFSVAFADALRGIALATDITVMSSVTGDLLMSEFSAPAPASTVSEWVESAQQVSAFPRDLVSWVLLPEDHRQAVTVTATVPHSAPKEPVGRQQFAEVLRQHPQSMTTILQTLQPLIEYDRTRRGQLVHTLEVLLDEAMNTSSAARALYLNRHSLLYRIKLIEELTGLSLKSAEDRFQLEVSVRVHEFNGARKTGPNGPR